MLMCIECGEFVPAIEEDGTKIPKPDACPQCDGAKFKDVRTEETIRTD